MNDTALQLLNPRPEEYSRNCQTLGVLQQSWRVSCWTKDGEAEIIAKIQGLRAERLTINEIADRLNSEGIKTRSGGRWHFTQVRRVLSRS